MKLDLWIEIALSVWTDRNPVLDQLVDSKSIGILGPKSRYARLLSGKASLTGNPVDILYGKVSPGATVSCCVEIGGSAADRGAGTQLRRKGEKSVQIKALPHELAAIGFRASVNSC